MGKEQKQVCDIKAGKRMTVAQSNEQLRVGESSAWNAKRAGTLDPTRSHLNFEIVSGGVIRDVDQTTSIPRRIKAILSARGIKDPNEGRSDDDLQKPRVGVRTYANIILEGSTETMRRLAFGNQEVSYEPHADNSHIQRSSQFEMWALDMYRFMARKYGEENIAAFVAHLDESNPHIHCTLIPITKANKLSWVEVFAGKDKYELSRRTKLLHDELAQVNEKWGLHRGDSVAVTGAQHKSYLQWMKEQMAANTETINRQRTDIDRNRQQLYISGATILKTERKLKGLNTMVQNLEATRARLQSEVERLDNLCKNGEISKEELSRQMDLLVSQIRDVKAKIEDKKQKLAEAERQYRKLEEEKDILQSTLDDIRHKTDDEKLRMVMDNVNGIMLEDLIETSKEKSPELEDFARKLPYSLRMEFEQLMEDSHINDIARKGYEIAAVAATIFCGYIDNAVSFAEDNGGGGGFSNNDLKRHKDEDDNAYIRRCYQAARLMMRPARRQLRR